MKMGNTRSPWRYDAEAFVAIQLGESAIACDFTLCLAGGNLPNFEAWSGPLRGLFDIGGAADSCDLP
jgi:hypothetical protein